MGMELAQARMDKIKGQEDFLDEMKRKSMNVTIFLINGVKLKGIISSYDKDCIVLCRDDNIQLIYKCAISTMMPYVEKMSDKM